MKNRYNNVNNRYNCHWLQLWSKHLDFQIDRQNDFVSQLQWFRFMYMNVSLFDLQWLLVQSADEIPQRYERDQRCSMSQWGSDALVHIQVIGMWMLEVDILNVTFDYHY